MTGNCQGFFVERICVWQTKFEQFRIRLGVYCPQKQKVGSIMELPKNLVQMGKPDKTHKIFIEDYVISYIKKWNRRSDGRAMGLALYGRKETEGGQKYYFLYGGAHIDGLEKRGPYLSQADKEAIAQKGREHFGEYEFLAWCTVKEELPDSLFVATQGKGIEVNGYACFYEKNESMLNYMLYIEEREFPKEEVEESNATKVKPSRGDWNTESYRNALTFKAQTEETKEKQKKESSEKEKASAQPPKKPIRHMSGLKTAAAAMFVSLCILGVTTVNSPEKVAKLKNTADYLIKELTSKQLPDKPGEVNKDDRSEKDATAEKEATIISIPVQGPAVTEDVTQAGPDLGNTTAKTDVSQGNEQKNITANEPPKDEPVKEQPVVSDQMAEPIAYTVKKGETLNGICLSRYGSISKVSEVCRLNNIKNADSIEEGQIILLP